MVGAFNERTGQRGPRRLVSVKRKDVLMNLDRRSFLKDAAVLGAATAASAGLASVAVADEQAALHACLDQAAIDASCVVVDPITDFVDEKSFDVVVVGAGTAGVPAVWGALEEGATVACLQKEIQPFANGNGSSGIILEESTEVGLLQYKQNWRVKGGYRMNPELLDLFVQHSGETIMWMLAKSHEFGFPPVSTSATNNQYDEGNICTAVINTFGPKPKNNTDIMVTLADAAAAAGAEFFYETPAVQLVVEDGAVKGVVAQTADGYVKFNAAKAVIIAAGDYQNNEPLVQTYSPDVVPFARKQFNRTGDGIIMAILAGGRMVPVNHAKTMHDMDAMPMFMTGYPFMAVKSDGKRFMNEEIPMESWDLSLIWNKDEEDRGHFYRIFDNAYQEKYGARTTIEQLENYIPDFLEEPKGVYPGLIDTHRADTLEELAEELGLPADALIASVEAWNEHCATGLDTEFGVARDKMKPIDTPPYWACRQWIRCSAINAGVVVDGCCRVLDDNDQPIPGLYSVGSGAGNICGGLEWNLAQGGLCCGSYMTMGRYAGIHAVKGEMVPSKPASYEETKQYWTK